MKRQAMIVSFGVLICVVCLAAVTIGGSHRPGPSRRGVEPGGDNFKTPLTGITPPVSPAPTTEPAPTFKVMVRPEATGDIRSLHGKAAEQITRSAPVPDRRLNHFRWIEQLPDYEFKGWGGLIEDVQPVDGGYLATVRFSPLVTYRRCSATTADYTIEKYSVVGDNLQLIEFIDPPDAVSGSAVTD